MSTLLVPDRPTIQKMLFDLVTRVRRLEGMRYPAVFEIKVFADANALDGNLPAAATDVVTGDGKFIMMIDEALDLWVLDNVQAYVTTVGAGVTSVMIRNVTQAVDMLTTARSIPSGEFTTDCDTEAIVDLDNDIVRGCDLIAIDVDAAGDGAQGLGVILTFTGPTPTPL